MADFDQLKTYEALTKLLPAQLDEVIIAAQFPRKYSSGVSPVQRADELIQWAQQSPRNGEALLAALQGVLQQTPVTEGPAPPDAQAYSRLRTADIPASRSPIVIAIEEAEDKLEERELLRTERHITVTLDAKQVTALVDVAARLEVAASIRELIRCGMDAWEILEAAQPGLRNLLQSVRTTLAEVSHPQPIAWTGRAALLARISRAVLVSCMEDTRSARALISVGCGSHYFHPLPGSGPSRTMQKRQSRPSGSPIRIKTLQIPDDPISEDVLREVTGGVSSEVVLVSAKSPDRLLLSLVDLVHRQAHGATRLVIGLGASELTPDELQTLLASLPSVSFGGPALRKDEVIREIERCVPLALPHQAVPAVLSSIREGLLQDAYARDDLVLFRDAACWVTWSWVGRPLFASRFGEVLRAAYPHLMDLRSIASPEWYFDRSKDIPDLYKAENLLERDADPARRFHLYLSGAGGTGKSCFLRYVYEKLGINQPQVLPVWYKVDAPSSDWENVERRVKEEVQRALERRLGSGSAEGLADDKKDLGFFLKDLVRKLKSHPSGLDEVVIFIDQLERTFESGDNPELYRLEKISKRFIKLLDTVGVGQGVRVFIASRKQYLPDFLSSFQNAFKYNLHFNVLQKISDDNEQIGFVQRVHEWCRTNKLIDSTVLIEEQAAKELAAGVDGHPLNMMLTLIHIFSQSLRGEVSRNDIKKLAPWEQLFYIDEQLASKDDIDWYFVLAMAHARTEIVRFEEVWWRLRLVTPALTERVEYLGRQGVLERLWLLGHLGRTVHPRPLGDDPAAFLEFFHANLRDHLVSAVMNYGGEDLRGAGRRGGTPPAWRALDRLLVVAKDWKQFQQLLLREDVDVLMQQKNVFVGKIKKERGDREVEAFYLLFMRDTEENRDELFQMAKECFVYSAVVHDLLGRWAFKQLFPNVADQVECCGRWLQRCDRDSRIKVLQYLVELRHTGADETLARLVFNDTQLDQDNDAWQQLASVLAEPLVASRYRGAFVTSLIRYALDHQIALGEDNPYARRFGEFCAASCDGDRNELLSLMGSVAESVAALQDSRLQQAARDLLEGKQRVDRWLEATTARGLDLAIASREIHDYIPPRIELRVGERLRTTVTENRLAGWHSEIERRLGVPVPPFAVSHREVPTLDTGSGAGRDHAREFELELLVEGRMIALGDFYPDLKQILRRQWDLMELPLPSGVIGSYNEALEECVVWLGAAELSESRWRDAVWDFEGAVVDWIHLLLRRHIDKVFTYYDIVPFINALASSSDSRLNLHELLRTISGNLYPLWQVLVNLCREGVPLADRRIDLMLRLQELVRQTNETNTSFLTQKLREHVGADLCRMFMDRSNQLPLMLLESEVELQLRDLLQIAESRHTFNLSTDQALKLAAAIRGHFEKVLRTENTAPVLLVLEDSLRLPLFRMMQHFDPRIQVLSFSELTSDVRPTLTVLSGVSLEATG